MIKLDSDFIHNWPKGNKRTTCKFWTERYGSNSLEVICKQTDGKIKLSRTYEKVAILFDGERHHLVGKLVGEQVIALIPRNLGDNMRIRHITPRNPKYLEFSKFLEN